MPKFVFFLALALTIAAPLLVHVDSAEGNDEVRTVSLSFSGANLSEVLVELAKQAGVEIVVEPEAEEAAGAVTVDWEEVSWLEAFDRILTVNCLVAEQKQSGEYVVRRAEVGLRDSDDRQ